MEKSLPINPQVKLRLYHGIDMTAPDDYVEPDRTETTDINQAQVVSSEIREDTRGCGVMPGTHYVLLDLDVLAHLVPSSTPGHSHLYIETPMTWAKYERLLIALADAGVIEAGYLAASIKRKATFLRLPWVKKEPAS